MCHVDFGPPSDTKRKILIAALVVSSGLALIVMFILWWKGYFGGRDSSELGNASNANSGLTK